MKFHLFAAQYVALHHGRIIFDHQSRCCITLSQHQFYNLGDIICTHDQLDLQAYPLHNQAWLHVQRQGVTLTTRQRHFRFLPESWVIYKRRIHPVIHFTLLHGMCEHHQHDQNHARRWRPRSRRYRSST